MNWSLLSAEMAVTILAIVVLNVFVKLFGEFREQEA